MAEERDVQDFCFQQLCRFRVFKTPSSLPVSTLQLIAASSKYGLLFVGVEKGLKVVETAQFSLIDAQHASNRTTTIVEDFPVKAKVELPAPASYVALSCDDLTLAVVVCETDNVCALMYDVRGFAVQDKNLEPFIKLRLGSGSGVKPLDLAWNPVQPNTLVSCLSDGSVGLYEVTDKLKIYSLPSSTGARCVCWSPKGKQCVIGKMDGTLVQYDPELKKKREWTCPKSVLNEGQHTVVGVTWVSTYVFIAAYVAIDAERSVQPTVVLVSGSKDGAPLYVNMEDICFGNGEDRDRKYFFQYIQKWEMVLATSNNACEAAIVAKHFDNKGTVWERWSLQDTSRAELPLTEEYNDTFPVGVTIDFSSQYHIPYGENQKYPPAPMLLLLSTDGVIVPYYMIYTHADVVPLTNPPQPLTQEGVRTVSPGSGTVQTDAAPVSESAASTTQPATSFQFMPTASNSASAGGLKTGPSFQFTPTAAGSGTTSTTNTAIGANTGPSFQFVSKPTTTNISGPSFSFVSSAPSATTTNKSLFGSGPGLFSSPGTAGTPPATITGFNFSGTSTPQASTKSSLFTPSTVASTSVATTSEITTPGLPKPGFPLGTSTQSTASAGSSGPATIFSSAAKPGSGFSFTPTTTKPLTGFSFATGSSNSSGFSFGSSGNTSVSTTGAESANKSTTSSAFTLTSATSTPVKPSLPQPTTSFPKTEQIVSKPDNSKPSAFVGFGMAPSATPGGSFIQNLLTSETPGGSNQPAISGSSGFVQQNKPAAATDKQSSSALKTQLSTEVTQPQPLSFNFATMAKSGSVTQPPVPTVSQLAPGSTNLPATGGQQGARTKTTVGSSTPVLATNAGSVPGETGAAVAGTGIKTPTTPLSSDPLDNTFTKSILEEMVHFEQELNSFKSRAGQNQSTVGDRDEMIKIKKQTDEMYDFCQEIRKTTKEQNKEIEEQKSLCLDLHAMIEDCRLREQRHYDPKYAHLLRSRALDPGSRELLRKLQQQFQILDQGLREVDAILDQEWDDYQNERNNRSSSQQWRKPETPKKTSDKQQTKTTKNNKNMTAVAELKTPSTDQVYRTIKGNRNVIVSQKNKLDDIENQLKQLRLFNRTSAWQQPQSETSTDIRNSELSTLADSLLDTSIQPLSSTRISAAGTSPQKEAKLRDYLSRREVPKIKSTRPENLSMSKIVSAEKLKLALRQKEAESDRSTPEEVKSATATKRPIASRSGARFPSQSDTRPTTQLVPRPQTMAAMNRPPAQFTATRQGMVPPAMNTANQLSNLAGIRMQRPASQNFNSSGQLNFQAPTSLAGVTRLGHIQVEDITPPSSTGYDEDDEEEDDDDDEYGEGFGPGYNITSTASGTSSQDNTESETDEAGTYGNQLQSGTLFRGPPAPVFSKKTTGFEVPATKPSLLTPGIQSGIPVSAAESVKIDTSSTKGPGFNFGSASPGFPFSGTANKDPGKTGFAFGSSSSSGDTKPGSSSTAGFTFGNTSVTSTKADVSVSNNVTATTSVKAKGGSSSDIKYYGGQNLFGKSSGSTSDSLLAKALADDDDLEEETSHMTSKPESSVPTAKPPSTAESTTPKSTVTPATNTGSVGGLFGQQPKPAAGIFGQTSSTANSIFGQGTVTAAMSGNSIFGKAETTSGTTIGGGLFGQVVSGSTTETPTSATDLKALLSSSEVSSTTGSGTSGRSGATSDPKTSTPGSGENKTLLVQETGQDTVATTTATEDSTTSKSIFGQPTSTAASSPFRQGLFGKGTSGGLFGQTSITSGSGTLGTSMTSAPTSLFGGTANTSTSVFGGSFGSSTSTVGTTGSATPTTTPLFDTTTAAATTSSSLFGGTTGTSTTGTSATTSPLFGGTTGSSTTAAPLFGGTTGMATTTATQLFGGTTNLTTTASQLFSGTSTSSTLFGGTVTSTVTPFGGTTNSTTGTPSPLFGGTSATTSATTKPNLFGSGSSSTTTSGFSFGQSSPGGIFGQTQSTGFGAPAFGQSSSPFGQTSSSSATGSTGGGSFGSIFSGLGGKPSEEKANTNVFGSIQFGSSGTAGSGLFGSQGSKGFGSTSPSGPFSSGGTGGSFSSGGTGSVAGSGFGVQQQTSSGFGGSPSFGSGPSFGGSPGFGSRQTFGTSPTFGGGSTFGGGATFGGSPIGGSTFGSPQQSSSTSGGFAGFASSSSPTFGSLAQNSDAPTFGGMAQQSAGFGDMAQGQTGFGGLAQGQTGFGGSPGFGGGSPGFGGGTSSSFGSSPAFTGYRS